MFAVFMIVTLAAIGVYLVTVSTGQARAVTQDELSVRAFQAARSGLDWGVYRVLRDSSCVPGPTAITFQAPRLATFRVEVACVAGGTETEGADTVNVFHITARACNAGNCTVGTPVSTYVERELQISVTRTP